MNSASVQIDRLNLRVPGLTRQQGQRLGETVARLLAESAPMTGKTVPALTVRVSSAGSVSVDRLAQQIVSGIHRSLK